MIEIWLTERVGASNGELASNDEVERLTAYFVGMGIDFRVFGWRKRANTDPVCHWRCIHHERFQSPAALVSG
jgi:hypothetical protein